MNDKHIATVDDLIAALTDYDPATPVRIATESAEFMDHTIGLVARTPRRPRTALTISRLPQPNRGDETIKQIGEHMSQRYDIGDSNTEVEIVGPGTDLGEHELGPGRHVPGLRCLGRRGAHRRPVRRWML